MKTQIIKKKKHTGRRIVLLNNEVKRDTLLKTARNASVRLAHFNDYMEKPEKFSMAYKEGDGIYFENLNVAVLNYNKEEELDYMKKGANQKEILITEPERYVYKIDHHDYVKGYRDGINAFYENYNRKEGGSYPYDQQIHEISEKFIDDELSSWGIKAVKVLESPYTGKNINIAVLDTGLYKTHIDLKGRNIITRSFFSSGSLGDADGHGSHCVGIACGFNDKAGMRYGVAMNSNIYCGKVLDDQGEGTDGSILAGIEWAIKNKCSVISMSLGAPCDADDPFSQTFENVAKRAMKLGNLIVAAAGNESFRPDVISPVGHPANCPSIMATGAVDSNLNIAWFSCAGLNRNGGQVDLVAPGVSVYSMINKQNEHEKWDGTSMATPFVSGIAALYLEQNPDATPLEVWSMLTQNAMRLNLSSIDGGSGLVQAPLA
ncbi:MAG: S8 family serine peptidase [Bacteroidales bacterium]|nr:S8 family serine peptidase [Bacteroidales bacterium]